MRQVLVVIGVLAATASVAVAASTPPAWTTAKAQVMLPDLATIPVPQSVKDPLVSELQALLDQFRLLQLTAQQEQNDWLLAATYGNYILRFKKARDALLAGLSIDSAKCVGQGKALSGKRYKRFRCSATSYVLEMPTVELRPVAGGLPEVVEKEPRRIGPYDAVFAVHVRGKTRADVKRIS